MDDRTAPRLCFVAVAEMEKPRAPKRQVSPKTGDKAVSNQPGVGWPPGISRQDSFLRKNSVDHGRPTEQD